MAGERIAEVHRETTANAPVGDFIAWMHHTVIREMVENGIKIE